MQIFLHSKIKTFGQERGKGSIRTLAWNMGQNRGDRTVRHFFGFVKNIFLGDSNFVKTNFYEDGTVMHFFLVVFCLKFLDGDRTVRYFFLVVFCQHGGGSLEMGQCGNFFGMGALRWDSVAIYF